MAVATNKQLGFVAALLTVLGLIYSVLSIGRYSFPFTGAPNIDVGVGLVLAPLSLIGLVLFLVAMNGFANDYQDRSIFNNALYAFLSGLILVGVTFGVSFFIVFSNIGNIIPFLGTPDSATQIFQTFAERLVPVLPFVSILGLVPAVFNMRAFNTLAAKSEMRMFRTVGLLGVVAAAFTIVLWFLAAALFYTGILTVSTIFSLSPVASIVSLVAWILAAKAFLSITVPTGQAPWTPTTQASMQPAAQVKYCPVCGAANAMDAEYCVRCGKKL
jgi:uncharacterized membrane protein/ribosomal protein L40E